MSPENAPPITLTPFDPSMARIYPGVDPLSRLGVIAVEGPDSESFLQGQLTQDMALMRAGQWLRAAHCTPKGRVLTIFEGVYWQDAFYLWTPTVVIDEALQRLQKYVLRAKVNLRRVNEVAALWLWGEGIEVEEALPVSAHCRALLGSPQSLEAYRMKFPALSAEALQSNALMDGRVFVYPETQAAFTPQMLNLDETGGISFKKGCYTGQEIVARTHYLGRVKRRMRPYAFQGQMPARGARFEDASGQGLECVDGVMLAPDAGLLLAVTGTDT